MIRSDAPGTVPAQVDASSPARGGGGTATDTDTSVRNAGWLVVQWGAAVAAGFSFALVVPRLMGPEAYGQYALLTSLSVWFVYAGGMGLAPVVTRYAGQFAPQGSALAEFFGRCLTLRAVGGGVAATLYLGLLAVWFPDLDDVAVGTVAAGILVQTVARLFFTLQLGVNRAARWGAGEAVRGWAILLLLVPGYVLGGVRGACVGLLLAEISFLALGVGWAHGITGRPRARWDLGQLTPYLRFGLILFASQLLFAAFQQSGGAMIRTVSGNYAEVGFFGLAFGVYMTMSAGLSRLTFSFVPLLASLRGQGDEAAARVWTERLAKTATVAGVLVAGGALAVGRQLVPVVFGAAYTPAGWGMTILMVGLPVLVLVRIGHTLSVAWEKPGISAVAGGVQFAVFWAVGPALVARAGNLGGCVAVVASSAVGAATFGWLLRGVAPYSLRNWWLAVTFGLLFAPIAFVSTGIVAPLSLYLVVAIAYGALLSRTEVLTWAEVSLAWRVFVGGARSPRPPGSGEWAG